MVALRPKRNPRNRAKNSPGDIVTEHLVEAFFSISSMIITDPVPHTPLIVPMRRRATTSIHDGKERTTP